MKKLIKLFGLFMAVFALAFTVACDDEPTDNPIEEPQDPGTTETPGTETPGTETPGTEDPGTSEPSNTKKEYSVLVKDIASKPLANFYVEFYLGDDIVDEGYTNSEGKFVTELEPNKYEVIIEGREGYYLNQESYETDLLGTEIEVICEIEDLSGVEANVTETAYKLGDVMYDFTVKNTAGESLTLYQLLNEYKVVVLNFWYTTCSACMYEFPYMSEAYQSTIEGTEKLYSDEVCILAVNPGVAGNGDTMTDIKNFKINNSIPFDVCMDYDYNADNVTMDPALTTLFGVAAYPTTVFIDSYGLIAEWGEGSVTSTEKWTQAFDKYIADDYKPLYTGVVEEDDYVKPDIVQPDSAILEEAANGTNYDGTPFAGTYSPEDNNDAEYSWPWINTTYEGKTCIMPTNQDQNPSFAIFYTTIEMKKGEVLAFDYYSSTETYDQLYVMVNNTIATQISGESTEWEKCYAYVALEDGTYEFGFCYLKDASYSVGDDAIYITNMRVVQEADIDSPTYIYRECATGIIDEFTMRYSNYVEVFYNEEDGYYHVGSADGALLLADLLSTTNWNNSTLYNISLEGKCIGADSVDYNKLIEEYAIYASNSSVGYTPVTKELANALKQVVKALGDPSAADNENQWLEVCVYYSAYAIEELGVPIIGCSYFEPIMFEGNAIGEPATASALFNRIILPRGFIFGFIPETSGVYQFYSTEEELETEAWICDDKANAIAEHDKDLRIFAQRSSNDEEADNNFIAHIYLEAGELYLFRAAFYDVYEYSEITVEIKYLAETYELLTIASPGAFTSSDDEMSDIISGNFVDIELNADGYYVVKDSKASDAYLYCDVMYVNNITGYSLLTCLSEKYNAFDFSLDEFGNKIFDENGYYKETGYNEDNTEFVSYFVCYDAEGNYYYVTEVGADGYTEENGYTYVMFDEETMDNLSMIDCTEYVKEYIETNMINDTTSELYGCVKVDEKFANVLGLLMGKYTFADVELSWAKLCYYYKYLGPVTE